MNGTTPRCAHARRASLPKTALSLLLSLLLAASLMPLPAWASNPDAPEATIASATSPNAGDAPAAPAASQPEGAPSGESADSGADGGGTGNAADGGTTANGSATGDASGSGATDGGVGGTAGDNTADGGAADNGTAGSNIPTDPANSSPAADSDDAPPTSTADDAASAQPTAAALGQSDDDPARNPEPTSSTDREDPAALAARDASESESALVTPTVSVIGRPLDALAWEYWAYEVPVSVESGTSAQDAVCAALDATGLAYKLGTYKDEPIITSLTSADGSVTLANKGSNWNVFRNGKPAGYFGQFGTSPVTSDEAITVCFADYIPSAVARTSVNVRVSVIGPNAEGQDAYWAESVRCKVPLTDGAATGWDASKMALDAAGLRYDYVEEYGYLNTITSPYTGQALGWDQDSHAYWSLYVNGEWSTVGASSVNLADGMEITWYYAPDAAELPNASELTKQDVAFSVVDASGQAATAWVGERTHRIDRGTTLHEFVEAMLDEAGIKRELSYDQESGRLTISSMTSPAGVVRASDSSDPGAPRWKAFVNGQEMEDGSTALTTGDAVTLAFTAADAPPQMITLAGAVIGRDAAGEAESWGSGLAVTVPAGADGVTVAKAVLDAAGASYALDEDATLNMTRVLSVTSPTGSGVTLTGGDPDEWGVVSGDAWYPYLNGECFDTWVSRFEEGGSFTGGEGTKFAGFVAGDAFTLHFGAYRDKLPNVDGGDPSDPGIEVDPDAPRPDLESPWPGFAAGGAAGGAVVQDVPTPTESAQLDWSYSYGAAGTGVSDPVIAGDWMYVVADGALIQLDLETGKELARADTGGSSEHFCRPVYADGLVIVPTDDGRLSAFTADALACAWTTPALATVPEGSYQSLSSLAVANGRVYAGFTVVGWLDGRDAGVAGALVCVDADSGEVLWRQNRATADTGVAEGWYWAGAAASGNDVVIGGESGAVELRDGGTGDVLSSVEVGAPVRASVVAVPGEEGAFLAVSYDGALHKVMRTGDALALAGSVSFAPKSTSTPAVVEGMALVGGLDAEGYGTLSVIDLATMKVSSTVRAGKGEVQSAPLVSVLPDGIWAYFTCNANPGGVYAYKLGDASAYQLYVPETGMQQHCTASVVTDARGNLYYTNDSGTLFKLAAARGFLVTFNTAGGSFVPQTQVADGHALARPADPVREGYVFGGWFADATCTRAWDFATPVTAPLTLHAKWTPKEDAKEPEGPQRPEGSDEPQNPGGQDGSAGNVPAPDDAAAGGTVPAATVPLGTVAPAAAPPAADARADAQRAEASAASADGAAAPKETRSAGSDVLAMSETVAEAAERRMPTLALVGLAAGATLLLAAAAWLAILRKREKEGGAR